MKQEGFDIKGISFDMTPALCWKGARKGKSAPQKFKMERDDRGNSAYFKLQGEDSTK